MPAPKVSVCIPVYNAARFVEETLQSALNQAYADFEIIAVDNRSDDGSWEVLQEFSRKDARIRCFRNDRNLGMVGNFNVCLQKAQGQYVHFLLADDLLPSPRSLSAPAAVLDSDETVSLVASPRLLIDEESHSVGSVSWFSDGCREDGRTIINLCLFSQKNLIGEPTAVMFRREQAARGFNPAYRQLVDLDMWFYILEQGRFAYIGEPLAAFRVHGKQLTRSYTRELAHLDDFLLLFKDYFDKEYVSLPWWFRRFYQYEKYYRLWKNGRTGSELKSQVRDRIYREFGIGRFWSLFPLYKVCNPWWKVSVKARLRAMVRHKA